MGAVIIGSGKALPTLEVPNSDMENLVETSDEWISTRTGISSRHIAIEESAIALAYSAASAAMGTENALHPNTESIGWTDECSPIDLRSIDLVIYATVTADTIVPSAAAALKKRLGLECAIAFDVNAACTGFIYALTLAESLMAASQAGVPGATGRNPIRRALVCGVDRLSRITDWQDRNTCVLFGDGAGAAVLEWREDEPGVLSTFLKNDDDEKNALTCPQSYESMQPFDETGTVPWNSAVEAAASDEEAFHPDAAHSRIENELEISERLAEGAPRQVIRMDGQTVFKFATRAMVNAINAVLERAGLTLEDIDRIVPHQANERIISFAAKKLGLSIDKFELSIDSTGNTSSASVPMALAEAYVGGRIKKGDKVIVVAFGGGLTSGAALFVA